MTARIDASRRQLTFAQRFIGAPLGFLWLCFLALCGIPIFITMTALYWSVTGVRSLTGGARRDGRTPGRRGEAEEPAA